MANFQGSRHLHRCPLQGEGQGLAMAGGVTGAGVGLHDPGADTPPALPPALPVLPELVPRNRSYGAYARAWGGRLHIYSGPQAGARGGAGRAHCGVCSPRTWPGLLPSLACGVLQPRRLPGILLPLPPLRLHAWWAPTGGLTASKASWEKHTKPRSSQGALRLHGVPLSVRESKNISVQTWHPAWEFRWEDVVTISGDVDGRASSDHGPACPGAQEAPSTEPRVLCESRKIGRVTR